MSDEHEHSVTVSDEYLDQCPGGEMRQITVGDVTYTRDRRPVTLSPEAAKRAIARLAQDASRRDQIHGTTRAQLEDIVAKTMALEVDRLIAAARVRLGILPKAEDE